MDKKNLVIMDDWKTSHNLLATDGWKTSHKKMYSPDLVEETLSVIEPEETDLNTQLGVMVGELIVAIHLPTLSTDMIRTRNVIQVDEALTKEWEVLEAELKTMYGKGRAQLSEKFYENRDWYIENIENKYLEDVLELKIPNFNPTNIDKFMKGVEEVLWDCDCSHYRISGIEGFKDYSWYRAVTLKRHVDEQP